MAAFHDDDLMDALPAAPAAVKTHTLVPPLNAAVDAFRNACWRQRPLLPARAALEQAVRDEVARQVTAIVDELTPPPSTDEELARWLAESITSATQNAAIDRQLLARNPANSDEDLQYWLREVRMFREVARRLGVSPLVGQIEEAR